MPHRNDFACWLPDEVRLYMKIVLLMITGLYNMYRFMSPPKGYRYKRKSAYKVHTFVSYFFYSISL